MFTIDESSGLLTTRQPLDREVKGAYRLVDRPSPPSKEQDRILWTVKLKTYTYHWTLSTVKLKAITDPVTVTPSKEQNRNLRTVKLKTYAHTPLRPLFS